MHLRPVRRYETPSYPTEQYLNEHPELLHLVPERWRHNRLVLAVLGAALPVLLAAQSQTRVAPVFIHGDGRGAFGCVAVNPPVFLSEEDARQVIQEEARKAGLAFMPDGRTIHLTAHPVTDPFEFLKHLDSKTPATTDPVTVERDLTLDGSDPKPHVSFEYVSGDDFSSWESKDRRMHATVSSYNMRATADQLRAGLEKSRDQDWIGVFYDPLAHDRNTAKKQLRMQVRDFVAWLKAQGVI